MEVRAPPLIGEGLAITPKTQEERDRRRWYPLLSVLILLPIGALGIYIFWRSRMEVKHRKLPVAPPQESTGLVHAADAQGVSTEAPKGRDTTDPPSDVGSASTINPRS